MAKTNFENLQIYKLSEKLSDHSMEDCCLLGHARKGHCRQAARPGRRQYWR
jgi:hypothetical protein